MGYTRTYIQRQEKDFKNFFIVCEQMVCQHVYLCTTCMQCLWKQKRASDPFDFQLQVVGSSHVGAGSQTQVLCKNKCSQVLTYISSPGVWPFFPSHLIDLKFQLLDRFRKVHDFMGYLFCFWWLWQRLQSMQCSAFKSKSHSRRLGDDQRNHGSDTLFIIILSNPITVAISNVQAVILE